MDCTGRIIFLHSARAASANNADQCDHRASADAGSVRNDLPRAPCPQVILKVRPPNCLDYRARYNTPASPKSFYRISKNPIACS